MIKVNLKKTSIVVLIILIMSIGLIFIIHPCPKTDPPFGILPSAQIKTENGRVIGGLSITEKMLLWYYNKFCIRK